MPLYLTASHSSRIKKPATLKRSSTASFTTLARTKSGQPASLKSFASQGDLDAPGDEDRLDATGKTIPSTTISPVKGVAAAIEHSINGMFCALPERAGMNSTRIAEVLNFRKALPSVVSLPHVHALIIASTRTERDIAYLVAEGKLRKVKITGRGNDISGLGELLISMKVYSNLLKESSLSAATVDSFLTILRNSPRATTLPASQVLPNDATALIRAGFLASSSLSIRPQISTGTPSHLATAAISRAASGTSAAVGGDAAFDDTGGLRRSRHSDASSSHLNAGNELILHISVPNIGPYLRLLTIARTHLLDLLSKSKYREAPLYLLRERWDGAIESDSSRVSSAKRLRGEFAGILPARTKKWKDLYGLSFDWILEECLGAGLVELFETHSVGHGVRVV